MQEKLRSGLLGSDEDLGHRVPPVVGRLPEVTDSVEATVHVDEALSRGVLDVVAVGGACRAGHGVAELVVDLGPCRVEQVTRSRGFGGKGQVEGG